VPSPAVDLARALIDEAIACGVGEVVLCPGSRSAPLAYAALAAAEARRVRVHVRMDERSAGFLALGLAKTTRRPALVVTTSGTAVANLHPAVLEAHHACVPLVVVTADRPRELRYSGANQTTVQPGIFGGAVRWEADIDAPTDTSDVVAIRGLVRRAYAAAAPPTDRPAAGEAGPVHLNLCLREPLVPDGWPLDLPEVPPSQGPGDRAEPVPPDTDVAPPVAPDADLATPSPGPAAGAGPSRTLVVLGDLVDPGTRPVVARFAREHGYPVIAEPFGRHTAQGAIPHGPLLLTVPGWLDDHPPERVLVVGRPTLSRAVTALLRRPGLVVEAVTDRVLVPDPAGVVSRAHPLAALADATSWPAADPAWSAAWASGGARLADLVAAEPPRPGSGLAMAHTVVAGLPEGATLFLGSSNVVRDVDLGVARIPDGRTVVASRGLAGIDGCVATAAGIALAEGSAYALMGDLTFLHDANALVIGPGEPRPDLTIVVVNDDGGGIFTLLEPGEPARAGAFERIFATPTATDLTALCRAHGVAHTRVATVGDLAAAVATPPDGLRVVEIATDRARHRADHSALRATAARLTW
jgi:2-succinyl-5-enolpyruvyl-6-hydroxy-3-cyclohexene-1-carboxylate synthase